MELIKTAKECCTENISFSRALVTFMYFKPDFLSLLQTHRLVSQLCKLPFFLTCSDPGLQEAQILKGHILHLLSTPRLATGYNYDNEVWSFDTQRTLNALPTVPRAQELVVGIRFSGQYWPF